MQSLNICGAQGAFPFEFTNLSGVWKFENYLTRQAHMSAARFYLTTRDGRPIPRAVPVPSGYAHRTESARRRWPPVVATHVGWPLLSTAPDVIPGSHRPLRFVPSLVQPRSSLLCSASAAASLSLHHAA
jgi:hypothetical protein